VPCLPLLLAQDGALPDRTVDHSAPGRQLLVVPVYKIRREHLFKNCPQWKSQQKTLWTTVLKETRKLPGPTRGKDRTKIAELFADERCSQARLDFLATTDVGRTAGPPVAEDVEAAASEASEWDSREREERLAALREEEELGAGVAAGVARGVAGACQPAKHDGQLVDLLQVRRVCLS